ncbi:ImmA/IrrE family metallo-endopeptidase [Streptococcus mutans]|uniref:ImmA/IrrE family metallo-endopeptidase n=1 Tax=Streptococcus mutans TaxID=1309 RepID=UPI0014555FF4|nr:ImmA/IrrE family metallo-endopeptidase [Streptococcus mutans]MCB4951772.1 ImmA/IrrE family metallo-endopeptidase [Streptococcus mutans]MCB5056482.1 ImmA/IrrE family metallo-endopeptidase [Streptococcus mutans]MCB5095911.1 ImmA/IrrE family metallo-endopeptidase [Streptococcus mutans]MDB8636658.1 ImmA/IrrE family metallo-endopeptidase [Streptococcus mutans]MDT9493623.1 ImmA/IrrE family metallo-endopeptidase [Streptococcus mutans]
MIQRLSINSDILSTYIKSSNAPMDTLQRKVPKIEKILEGTIQPTFNQISQIAKVINVPTGILLLNNKVATNNVQLNFRTLDSQSIDEMSPELRDTILEMQEKQEFLRSEIETELDFVGKYSISENLNFIINDIKEYLTVTSYKDRLRQYRAKINQIGVFVFFNGKIKDNTHRNLDLSEFRGFVLTDKCAPVIFINQKDSKNGQLFTLVHEFVHLFLGENNLLETSDNLSKDPLEVFVNKITAEILVPKQELIEKFNDKIDFKSQLENIARYFEVSKFVVVRRLLDLKYITKRQYDCTVKQLEKEFEKIPKKDSKVEKGNYNNNLKFRMDHNFFQYVNNAVMQNRLTYTDAFNIVGVGYKGYKTLLKGG